MSDATVPANQWGVRCLLTLAVLGIAVRLALSAVSSGSGDAHSWYWFGQRIAQYGILNQYDNDLYIHARKLPPFNHPPIPGWWAMIAYELTHKSAISSRQDAAATFPFLFRLPGILADALSCWLLYRIGCKRAGPRGGAILALAFAWSPCAILIAGHHGSTDSIYAALCLLAAYCAADLDAPLLAGLALGAAINVKLIPVFLIPAMLALYRSWRPAGRFIAGLAVMVIPFVPILIACPGDFFRNALTYASVRDYWGVNQFLLEMLHVPQWAHLGGLLLNLYSAIGRFLVAVCIIGFAAIARRRQWNFYNAAAGSAALFLILTPGFGMQYLIFVLPALFAANFRAAMRYGIFAGCFLFIAYALFWDGKFPIVTYCISGVIPRGPGALFGLLAWTTLVVYIWKLIFTRGQSQPAGNAVTFAASSR